jgi:hypothetical protein
VHEQKRGHGGPLRIFVSVFVLEICCKPYGSMHTKLLFHPSCLQSNATSQVTGQFNSIANSVLTIEPGPAKPSTSGQQLAQVTLRSWAALHAQIRQRFRS